MAADKKDKILAVDIKQPTVVAKPLGGATDAVEGDVFIVGEDVTEEDAGFLVASKIAEKCAPALKEQRRKEAARLAKLEQEKPTA